MLRRSRGQRFHVLPASVDLYTPSPKCALRWLLFSPVPSQTTFESFGSTTTQQSVKDAPSSKIGSNVMPRFIGLPQAAERRRDVPDVRVLRVDLDVDDAAGVTSDKDDAAQTVKDPPLLVMPRAEPGGYQTRWRPRSVGSCVSWLSSGRMVGRTRVKGREFAAGRKAKRRAPRLPGPFGFALDYLEVVNSGAFG